MFWVMNSRRHQEIVRVRPVLYYRNMSGDFRTVELSGHSLPVFSHGFTRTFYQGTGRTGCVKCPERLTRTCAFLQALWRIVGACADFSACVQAAGVSVPRQLNIKRWKSEEKSNLPRWEAMICSIRAADKTPGGDSYQQPAAVVLRVSMFSL